MLVDFLYVIIEGSYAPFKINHRVNKLHKTGLVNYKFRIFKEHIIGANDKWTVILVNLGDLFWWVFAITLLDELQDCLKLKFKTLKS